MKRQLIAAVVAVAATAGVYAAEESGTYDFDKGEAHQFITFKISHLGYSWLYGRFNTFDGQFIYDADNPEKSSVTVTIETGSVDTNNAERDKHVRGKDLLYVDRFPQASFISKRIVFDDDASEGEIVGELTLRGVTREVTLDVDMVGYGKDPWGGYRMGFEAETEFKLADFGIPMNLGETAETVEMIISVEGVRQ